MHGGGVLVAYADNDITEYDLSAGAGADLDRNDLLVLKAVFLGGLGVKVDVTLCGDDALRDLDLALGAYELAAGGACHVAGLSDGSGHAELARVGQRNFNLILRTLGTEDRHGHLTSGADDRNLFKAGKLTGLGQILFVGQLIAFAVERVEGCSANMHVMCGGFYHNFHCYYHHS